MVTAVYVRCLRSLRSIARETGLLAVLERRLDCRYARWLRSLLALYDPEDLARIDTPWWTLKAAAMLDIFLRHTPNSRVFEYGSGASTVWLARRAGSVISVDHDPKWKPVVDDLIAPFPNVISLLAKASAHTKTGAYRSFKRPWQAFDFEAYVRQIDEFDGCFDLIVIDGRCRARCLDHALPKLKESGVILFDNSGRRQNREAILRTGLPAIETFGLTACLPYPDRTTLIFKHWFARTAVLLAFSAEASHAGITKKAEQAGFVAALGSNTCLETRGPAAAATHLEGGTIPPAGRGGRISE